MSSKSAKKPKKVNLPPVPRQRPQLEEEYGRLVAQLGQNTYQQFVLVEDAKRINSAIMNLNHEANARATLDKQEADAKPAVTPESAPEAPKEVTK